jgi:hypothetical protein
MAHVGEDRARRSPSVTLQAGNHAGSRLAREGECGELDGRRQGTRLRLGVLLIAPWRMASEKEAGFEVDSWIKVGQKPQVPFHALGKGQHALGPKIRDEGFSTRLVSIALKQRQSSYATCAAPCNESSQELA